MNLCISINRSTKLCVHVLVILQMACVGGRSHGGDGDGTPPRRPTKSVPGNCESKKL